MSTVKPKPSLLSRAETFVRTHKKEIDAVQTNAGNAFGAAMAVKDVAKDGYDAAKHMVEKGVRAGGAAFQAAKRAEAADPTGKLNLFGKLGLAGKAMGVVTGLAQFPSQYSTIAKAAQQLRASSGDERKHALVDLARQSRFGAINVIETARGALTTAVTARKLVTTYKAAGEAFSKVAPAALPVVKKAAQYEAMKSVFQGGMKAKDVLRAVSGTTLEAAKVAGEGTGGLAKAMGVVGRAAGKATAESAAKAAGEAAIHAGAEVAGKGLAKAAARFAPGANIAMAVIDSAVAVATIRDPKASMGAKISSGITAVGSIVAATNIPVVSQIGAGVSIVSGFVGSFFH